MTLLTDATRNAMVHMRALEEQSAKATFVHARHPLAHLLVTLFALAAAASFDRYALAAPLPLLIYPLFMLTAGEIPLRLILARMLPALPLALGVGLAGPVADRVLVEVLPGVTVAAGWISLLSIALRGCLCVACSLLMMAVTGMPGLSEALLALRVPRTLVTQLLFTFRSVQTLAEEAGRISLAYRLRAPGKRAPSIREWGTLAGQWLLRSLRRAERIDAAMRCRGFSGAWPSAKKRRWRAADTLYALAWCGYFVLIRSVNIPSALGQLAMRLMGGM